MPLPQRYPLRTILLVEHDPLLLKLIRTILERAGFTVLSSVTADGAIRIEQDFKGTIDLLLTGVSMPPISGPKLAEELERRRPAMRVMLMSSDPTARELALNRGWYFTQKPFLPAALLGGIENMLALDDVSGADAGS